MRSGEWDGRRGAEMGERGDQRLFSANNIYLHVHGFPSAFTLWCEYYQPAKTKREGGELKPFTTKSRARHE